MASRRPNDFAALAPEWHRGAALRTDYARRQALVEIVHFFERIVTPPRNSHAGRLHGGVIGTSAKWRLRAALRSNV